LDQITFGKPGNKEQYKPATEVLQTMESIKEALADNRREDAKKSLEEGKIALLIIV